MLHLKKYLTEGLIQVAILLSLCGVRVDVGLEPYLPPAWQEMILGPTSALTQTQFHNLRNRLEDGHSLHPKSVDLDEFFTARRLLGWVHSLDRLQVPHAEVETWLVQREPDSFPGGRPDQPSPLERAAAGLDRDRADPALEPGSGPQEEEEEDMKEDGELTESPGPIDLIGHSNQEGTHHLLDHNNGLEEEEELARIYWADGRGGRGSYHINREPTENEADQTSRSLQECLRLLEETFPFSQDPQLRDGVLGVSGGGGAPECFSPGPLVIAPDDPPLDVELHWQDLLAIMEPQDMDVDTPSLTSFPGNRDPDNAPDDAPDSRTSELQNSLANQGVGLTEAPLQHDLEPALLPLIPSAQLDDHNLAFHIRDNLNPSHAPPDHMNVLPEDPSGDFSMGLENNTSTFSMGLENNTSTFSMGLENNTSTFSMGLENNTSTFSMGLENNTSTFSMGLENNTSTFNLLTQRLSDNMDTGPCLQCAPYPETYASFDVKFRSSDLASSRSSPPLELNGMTPIFLDDDEEEDEGEDALPSPLANLLEDAAIMDEISLLDLALEEGFNPEMAARLEEEGYFDPELAQREVGPFGPDMADTKERDDGQSGCRMAAREEHGYPRRHQQGGEEADSDSGLSLDFSYSPASPCASEASSYTSSSSSSSSSAGSPFSEEEEQEAEEGADDSDVEVEVTIKQEEQEEEMGAAGGSYSSDVKKLFPAGCQEPKLFSCLPWLEHIGHDHTYNQPRSPVLGKMAAKHPKSSLRHSNTKPYHRSSSQHVSDTKLWNRDERRATTLKIPFSNELIVNLPVEEFNKLLANQHLSEQQLTLIRDIRRRGKNKLAAQNCRRKKQDILLGLEEGVVGLKRHRSRLLREKQEALRSLQEMKRQLGRLYQEVFSSLRDAEGRPLDATRYMLQFGPSGRVTVASRQQGAALPPTDGKTTKKQRDKKK